MDHDGRIRSRHDEAFLSSTHFQFLFNNGVKPPHWGGKKHASWAWGSRWNSEWWAPQDAAEKPKWRKRWCSEDGLIRFEMIWAHESELRVPCLFVHWWFIGRYWTVSDLINHYQGFLLRVPKFQYWEDRSLPKQCHKKTLYSFDLIDKYVVKPLPLKLTAGPLATCLDVGCYWTS